MRNINFSLKQVKIFKKYGIIAVYLFGSQAEKKFIHPLSDIDIGIIFNDFSKIQKNITIVHKELSSLFLRKLKIQDEKNLDLVFLQETSYGLQYKTISEGKILYCSDPIFMANYRENVMKKYFDLKPIYNYFFQVLLESVK